jgi:N-acetylglutamate synthase-like GNAT family acetyltransferase
MVLGGVDMSYSSDVSSDRSRDLAPENADMEPCLRSYCAKDQSEVVRLYHHGLLTGISNPLDSATDLDDIEDVYLKRPGNHFWVVEVKDRLIATIAIMEDDQQVAHVRRLRLDPAWKIWRGDEVVSILIKKAAYHARQHDCLKLVLHEMVNDEWVIAFLHKQGFDFARARKLDERLLLEFYLNLYYVQPVEPTFGNEGFA